MNLSKLILIIPEKADPERDSVAKLNNFLVCIFKSTDSVVRHD
jgi:hypothetical protein